MTGKIACLTSDLERDLDLISSQMDNEILRAEKELELEHAHLRALVTDLDPAINEQLSAMEDSLTRLYHGLEKAQMYLQLAQGESYILRQQLTQQTAEPAGALV